MDLGITTLMYKYEKWILILRFAKIYDFKIKFKSALHMIIRKSVISADHQYGTDILCITSVFRY